MAGLADVAPSLLDEVRALEYANAMERLKSFCDAQRHEALATFAEASTRVPDTLVPGAARLVQLGGAGTPAIDEFAMCEFAAAAHLACSPTGAARPAPVRATTTSPGPAATPC
jgi:hypothetical protein